MGRKKGEMGEGREKEGKGEDGKKGGVMGVRGNRLFQESNP